jgi:predicted permease
MDGVAQDLRLAARGLRRSPAFAGAAVLTLAVGIGAAIAIFGVVDAAVLRPLPFRDVDRLVRVWETTPRGDDFSASEPNYLDFRAGSRTLDELAAFRPGELAWSGGGEPQQLSATWASHTLLPALGLRPALGRGFAAGEDRPGGERRVVLLGHELWRTRFAADRTVIGRTLTLDGEPYGVIGVLPPEAALLGGDLWVPLAAGSNTDRGDHWLTLLGRLAPGATPARAQADLAAIAARIGAEHPLIAGWSVRVEPLVDWLIEPRLRQAGVVLLAAVGLLLLMACANVASLLLARATAREGELGIRVALGALRGRLLRQLLTESALLAGLGGTLGLGVAAWALRAARGVPPDLVPRLDEARLDARAALFALGVVLLTTVLVGALPALTATRAGLQSRIGQVGRSGGGGRQHRLREALVVGQLALAVVLLLGAGLLARSLVRLYRIDPGFATAAVWTAPLQLPATGYEEPWQKVRFYNRVVARLRESPAVAAAGATTITPFGDWNFVNDVTPEERAATAPPSGLLQAAWRVVTPGYFGAAGVPLLRGRDFTLDDRWDEAPVAVVSRSLAEELWPGQDPVGRRLFWGGTDGTPKEVVGVVGDIRDFALDTAAMPTLFLPIRQVSWPAMTLVVRARPAADGVAAAVRRAVWAEDPALPVPEVLPLAERRAASLAPRRLNALVLGAFAAAALLLATVGVYGVLAYAVAQRRREIAVRMALGAEPAAVTRLLVRRGAALTAAGLGLGLLGAGAGARLVRGLLFETSAADPLTLAAVPALLLAVALLATVLPARRAGRTDPMLALRQE